MEGAKIDGKREGGKVGVWEKRSQCEGTVELLL